MKKKGLLIVVSGASGVGKGSVIEAFMRDDPNIRYSISATTRKKRDGEKEGVNYFFYTREKFLQLIEEGRLLEWDEYCGNLYGTPLSYVEEVIDEGFDVILEITVEGALNVKNKYKDAVCIFILPPSFEELRRRLLKRNTENPEVVENRLKRAKEEVKMSDRYDYQVVNDNIEKCANEIKEIIIEEKLKTKKNLEK